MAQDRLRAGLHLRRHEEDEDAHGGADARCRAALEVCRQRARFAQLVFVDEAGQPLSITRIRRAFAIAKVLARINRPFRIHDLRHTFGSRLASEGVEILTISRVMAHKDIATTQRYARLQLRAFERVRSALDRA